MAVKAKPAWLSKTNIFGLLWVLVGVAGLFGYGDFAPDANWNEAASIVNGIVIIVLRFVTKDPVYLRK